MKLKCKYCGYERDEHHVCSLNELKKRIDIMEEMIGRRIDKDTEYIGDDHVCDVNRDKDGVCFICGKKYENKN